MRDNDNDSTVKKRSETVSIYVKNNLKNEDSDFFEVVLKHEEQVPVESEVLEVRRSTRKRRPPA